MSLLWLETKETAQTQFAPRQFWMADHAQQCAASRIELRKGQTVYFHARKVSFLVCCLSETFADAKRSFSTFDRNQETIFSVDIVAGGSTLVHECLYLTTDLHQDGHLDAITKNRSMKHCMYSDVTVAIYILPYFSQKKKTPKQYLGRGMVASVASSSPKLDDICCWMR